MGKVLQATLALVPLLTPLLYLMGTMYHESYLSAYGLDSSIFQLSVDRTLFFAFIAFVGSSVKAAWYLVSAAIVLIVLAVGATLLSLSPRVRHLFSSLDRKVVELTPGNKPPAAVLDAANRSMTLATWLLVLAGSVLALVLIPVLAVQAGKEQAHSEIATFASGRSGHVELFLQERPPLQARQLLCGSHFCAFWTCNDALIVRHDQVTRIVSHPRPASTQPSQPARCPASAPGISAP